ncbi:hypothetical protein Tco_0185863 [Tanacetum coccineum]
MNDKMKDPECVKKKVKTAPHDYSKENYLATFTPQKQLTPEQIFWSKDLINMKAEALKEQTIASRPLKALTVYPPNTPATLVPRVLPSKSQHDEIEQKNLLIANDNLIADCLSKEVFYIATNSELTVSRFTEMHVAHTVVQARCLELEAELSKLLDRYAIDVEPIPPRNRNNREVHLDYLKHLKGSVETLREIVEEAKVERPLYSSLTSACLYTKHSQELLEYVIGSYSKDFNQRDKKHVATPLTRKKQVTFEDQCETSNSNTHTNVAQLNIRKTNVPVPPSTGVNNCTDASGS